MAFWAGPSSAASLPDRSAACSSCGSSLACASVCKPHFPCCMGDRTHPAGGIGSTKNAGTDLGCRLHPWCMGTNKTPGCMPTDNYSQQRSCAHPLLAVGNEPRIRRRHGRERQRSHAASLIKGAARERVQRQHAAPAVAQHVVPSLAQPLRSPHCSQLVQEQGWSDVLQRRRCVPACQEGVAAAYLQGAIKACTLH